MKAHQVEYWLKKIRQLDPDAEKKLLEYFGEPENNFEIGTKVNYAKALYYLLRDTKKPLSEITLEDVKLFLARRKEQVKYATFAIDYMLLRRFLRYLGIELNSKLRFSKKEKYVVDPNQFLTEAEFFRLLKHMNQRDRALTYILRETGMRIGEALALDIKDFKKVSANKAYLHVRESKTCEREVLIIKSVPEIEAWLRMHPDPKPDSPLFVRIKRKPVRLDYQTYHKNLKNALKRAGINKRVHPHLFRHQRATELLSRVPEAIAKRYLGWKPGSRMTERYNHLKDKETNQVIEEEEYGMRKEEKREEKRGIMECPVCGAIIEKRFKFCPFCGSSIEEEKNILRETIKMTQARLIFIMEKFFEEHPQELNRLLRWLERKHSK